MEISTPLTFGTRIEGSIEEVRPAVEAALKAEGFGILTEIDAEATLRARLGAEIGPFMILGTCNPALALAAIRADPSVAALLPCNVVLRADGPRTVVEAESQEAAANMFIGHPHFTIFPGDGVEIMECLPIPQRP